MDYLCAFYGLFYGLFYHLNLRNMSSIIWRTWNALCVPVQFYILMFSLSIIHIYYNATGTFQFKYVIQIIIWVIILNWLCKKKMTSIAWTIAILPSLIFAFKPLFHNSPIYNQLTAVITSVGLFIPEFSLRRGKIIRKMLHTVTTQ